MIFTTDFYSFLLYCVITPLSKVSGGLCTERHVNPPHYLCDIPKWGVCYQKLLLVCLLYLFFINWSSINRDDGFLFFIPSHFFMPMPFITNYTVWVVLIIECLVVFYIIGLWSLVDSCLIGNILIFMVLVLYGRFLYDRKNKKFLVVYWYQVVIVSRVQQMVFE